MALATGSCWLDFTSSTRPTDSVFRYVTSAKHTKRIIVSLDRLTTESRNPESEHLDLLSSLEIVYLMNAEDRRVVDAIHRQSESIARAIDVITGQLRKGGRLIYIGAGTSGRLGVLDASECPPTFNTPPELVVGLIAGGAPALTRSAESMEDHPEIGVQDLQAIDFCDQDVLVGIASSGRTPYVIGGLQYAQKIGAHAIALTCNEQAELHSYCDFSITPVAGPEIVSGSTRLKAGTATKMVLNMLTTGTMVRLGKTFGNLMVDLRATNTKLIARARGIVSTLTGLSEDDAEQLLKRCDGELKTAVVMQLRDVEAKVAREFLAAADDRLRDALGDAE